MVRQVKVIYDQLPAFVLFELGIVFTASLIGWQEGKDDTKYISNNLTNVF